ncbi:MAG TPA: glycosyltransferase family 1 protein, partial [Gemmataceae bacterium]|nr:glycosyltransferase family 1 protein [Gemmataceae bacterium]
MSLRSLDNFVARQIVLAGTGTSCLTGTERSTRMRVVVNQLASLGARTGVGHYTAELIRCLRPLAGGDQIAVFPEGWVGRTRAACARLRPRLEGASRTERPAAARSGRSELRVQAVGWLRQLGRLVMAQHFRMVCATARYDLYHEPNFIPLPTDRPTVATIHDLSVLLHPEWHPADRVKYFDRHFETGVGRCRHFFAISEFGRQEIVRHLHISPHQVTRTYMGIRPGLAPMDPQAVAPVLRQLKFPPRYLLYLGTIEPRKNLRLLLEAYCSLPAPVRADWPLLLVGGWGWNAGDVADYLHREARHRGVMHVGYVADEHLPAIYNGARALLYPTLYEGFGLPPIEMMACGGAVLASTAGAVAETVGRRAHLLDAGDQDGWRAAILRVTQDNDWHRSLRKDVTAVAAPFTWEQCVADTLRGYRQVA